MHLADISESNNYCMHFAKPVARLCLAIDCPVTVLMVDEDTYMCNFGCANTQTKNLRSILQHFLEAHTREECAMWSLGYDWMYRMYVFGMVPDESRK